jgi:hypothetical protein
MKWAVNEVPAAGVSCGTSHDEGSEGQDHERRAYETSREESLPPAMSRHILERFKHPKQAKGYCRGRCEREPSEENIWI